MVMADLKLPPMYRIRQRLDSEEIGEAARVTTHQIDSAQFKLRVHPGMKVAVTAGSRGIDRIVEVLAALTRWLKARGAEPFIVTAMGSHGGGTSGGRLDVLTKLGITEESVGAPLVADGDTTVLAEVDGVPLHCATGAVNADGIIVVNRVKPHTSYSGEYESGLVKMLAVGLGMSEGAEAVHSLGAKGLSWLVPKMANEIIEKWPVLFGIALVENGMDRLKVIEAIPAEEIMVREPELLKEAYKLKPGLPFEAADVLVVDRMGKNISGTGMDTKVIGRLYIDGEEEPEIPSIDKIAVLRLWPSSGGNAYGIGLADVTTDAVIKAMNPGLAEANAKATGFIRRAILPDSLSDDQQAVMAAVSSCDKPDLETLKIARIRDTLHLDELFVSKALLDSIGRLVEVVDGPVEWDFDEKGNLDILEDEE